MNEFYSQQGTNDSTPAAPTQEPPPRSTPTTMRIRLAVLVVSWFRLLRLVLTRVGGPLTFEYWFCGACFGLVTYWLIGAVVRYWRMTNNRPAAGSRQSGA